MGSTWAGGGPGRGAKAPEARAGPAPASRDREGCRGPGGTRPSMPPDGTHLVRSQTPGAARHWCHHRHIMDETPIPCGEWGHRYLFAAVG
jgi:hypothetical protein